MEISYTKLIAGCVFPLQERLKRHDSVAVRRRLEESQWWSRGRIAELQRERLARFIARVAATVPYYRRQFSEHGVAPAEVREVTDLARLPFLTKDVVRSNLEALTADGAVGLVRMNTGGSTGQPMIFMVGRERVSHDVGAKWRATRWWGVDIGDPELVVWGSPIELGAQDRLRILRDRIFRTRLFSAFKLSEARIDELLRDLERRPPRMLFGYPSALALIAERAEQRGVMLAGRGIRVAFVTAEKCYPHQRAPIARVFGCPVANGYGGRDAGFIAHECPNGGLHVSAEDIVLEIVDTAGAALPAGKLGEITVTHLASAEFPFVRYRTGDMGVLSAAACGCGRGLPLLEEVSGRSTDFIRAADGSLMHGLSLIYVVRDLPGIAGFKIIQESIDWVRVLVVPGAGYSAEIAARLSSGMRQRLGEGIEVVVECVREIPPETSGKYRYVVNAIGSPPVRNAVGS